MSKLFVYYDEDIPYPASTYIGKDIDDRIQNDSLPDHYDAIVVTRSTRDQLKKELAKKIGSKHYVSGVSYLDIKIITKEEL